MFLRHCPHLLVLGVLVGLLTASIVPAAEIPMRLIDTHPAPLTDAGWEQHSYPIGNGHGGMSLFGGIADECLPLTDKAVYVLAPADVARWKHPVTGLSTMAELRLDLEHGAPADQATDYLRTLDLGQALAEVRYRLAGATFHRQAFASYPDRCIALRLTADVPGRVSFRLRALHPHQDVLAATRRGTALVEGDHVVLRGDTDPYGLQYEVRIAAQATGGTVQVRAGELEVRWADTVDLLITWGTNHRLSPEVFLAADADKLRGRELPSAEIAARLDAARNLGWDRLRARHEADHGALFARVDLDLAGDDRGLTTADLRRAAAHDAAAARRMTELLFQYGRYLLIASSRVGTLPANLQGTWTRKAWAPWTGGYFANINLQMNYWPAFSTNLAETFPPYLTYLQALFPRHQQIARQTLGTWRPGSDLRDGWAMGTHQTAFVANGPSGTSGAGTGPFMLLALWDAYRFTGDRAILEAAWPFFLASSRFLVACLVEQSDGTLLCRPSWSPEQERPHGDPLGRYLELDGTSYDQQLIAENHRMTLAAARILGVDDPLLPVLAAQLPRLDPAPIGTTGHLKEFRQEQAYGDLGEAQHRHISQVVGLFPGTILTERPEWLAAARVSLDRRGDVSTGWGMAHRLNAWARLGDGDRAHGIIQGMIATVIMDNLWDTHPPFQIDGNFGLTAGIAEMLVQSHGDVIDLLPALPTAWPDGAVRGLCARGGVTVAITWRGGRVTAYHLTAPTPRPVTVRVDGRTEQVVAGP